jgi:hypothetical protein
MYFNPFARTGSAADHTEIMRAYILAAAAAPRMRSPRKSILVLEASVSGLVIIVIATTTVMKEAPELVIIVIAYTIVMKEAGVGN